ncbi:hypothetical protein H0H93_000297 [Arthromyces matolae]|nr:hypothetical protein H0H93_000297 [Arthromyces matolae]
MKTRGTKDPQPGLPKDVLKVAPLAKINSIRDAEVWVDTVPVVQQVFGDSGVSAPALAALQWMTAVLLSTTSLTELACRSWMSDGKLQSVEHDVAILFAGSKVKYLNPQSSISKPFKLISMTHPEPVRQQEYFTSGQLLNGLWFTLLGSVSRPTIPTISGSGGIRASVGPDPFAEYVLFFLAISARGQSTHVKRKLQLPKNVLKVAPLNGEDPLYTDARICVDTVPVVRELFEGFRNPASSPTPLQWMTAVLLSTAYLTEVACRRQIVLANLQAVQNDVSTLIRGSTNKTWGQRSIITSKAIPSEGVGASGQGLSLPGINEILGPNYGI